MNNSQLPIARKEGLVIQEMPEEILVYDLETNKAHCLNQTAAFVWEACDGINSATDIARLFGEFSGNTVSEDLVWLAIDQLNEKNLLEKEMTVNFQGQTRREIIKKIGLATIIALPIVSSLVAPMAASAGSACIPNSCTCTRPTACPGTLGVDPDCNCASPATSPTCNTANCASCACSSCIQAGSAANATAPGTCSTQAPMMGP